MLKRAANPPTIKHQSEVITVITLENAKCYCGSTQSSCRLRHGFMSQAKYKNLVLQSRITQLKASTSCIEMPTGIHLVRERACWTVQSHRSQAEVPCYPLPEISILTEIMMVLRDVKAHFQVQVGLLEEEVELFPSRNQSISYNLFYMSTYYY